MSTEAGVGPPFRPIRSFVMRRGHVTAGQRRAFDELFPRYALAAGQVGDLQAVFGRPAPRVLEIGFGMGETTATIAAAHPEIDFIAAEVYVPGIGGLSRRLADLDLHNVRIHQGDAVALVDALPDQSLSGVHIYFPDPWQKARHHKRRLIAQPFAGRLAAKIASGGYLHCATDWEDYAVQMLAVLSAEPALVNRHAGYAPSPGNPLVERPTTKFHARGERLGHGVWDLVYLRAGPVPRPPPA